MRTDGQASTVGDVVTSKLLALGVALMASGALALWIAPRSRPTPEEIAETYGSNPPRLYQLPEIPPAFFTVIIAAGVIAFLAGVALSRWAPD